MYKRNLVQCSRSCAKSLLHMVLECAYTAALLRFQGRCGCAQVDGMMVAQPPAAGCFESVLSPEAWHESSILLDALLHWFEMWHQDAPGAPGPTGVPHLPRTTVRFDAVLCETVRAAVHSNAISNVDRISMVKWLLLPYQMRKDRLEPFSGGSGETAQASWVCTVQVRTLHACWWNVHITHMMPCCTPCMSCTTMRLNVLVLMTESLVAV